MPEDPEIQSKELTPEEEKFSQAFDLAKEKVLTDREQAYDTYLLLREMVENSNDLEVQSTSKTQMVGSLAVAVRADTELVKLASIAADVLKSSMRSQGKDPAKDQQPANEEGGMDRRKMLDAISMKKADGTVGDVVRLFAVEEEEIAR